MQLSMFLETPSQDLVNLGACKFSVGDTVLHTLLLKHMQVWCGRHGAAHSAL